MVRAFKGRVDGGSDEEESWWNASIVASEGWRPEGGYNAIGGWLACSGGYFLTSGLAFLVGMMHVGRMAAGGDCGKDEGGRSDIGCVELLDGIEAGVFE